MIIDKALEFNQIKEIWKGLALTEAAGSQIDETSFLLGTSSTYKNFAICPKINDIFSSSHHVYKSRVRITLKDDIQERTIIGKTSNQLLTLSGDKISIVDIVDIERI